METLAFSPEAQTTGQGVSPVAGSNQLSGGDQQPGPAGPKENVVENGDIETLYKEAIKANKLLKLENQMLKDSVKSKNTACQLALKHLKNFCLKKSY